MKRKKIAIIGSGVSGLSCAHFLHPRHEVTLFEKDGRVGGHSHTISIQEEKEEVSLDTGFMVYNEVTYPLLTRLFKDLGVETKPTSMSFSVQHVRERFEFNGSGFDKIFGQRKNIFSPRFWKMLLQIKRFNEETVKELEDPQSPGCTLEEYVKERGYGDDFLKWYLSPMAAAVWSSPPERISAFPAHTLMRFWHNHGFLGLDTHHPWRTVECGSRQYVEKLTSPFSDCIEKDRGVQKVRGRTLVFADGEEQEFDAVIFASHGDQSHRLLEDATEQEDRLLACFQYQDNVALVHSDPKFMPQTKRCWASWNYRVDGDKHSTHYWMNSLQGVSERDDYFVSINPPEPVDEASVKRRLNYEHPIFDLDAIAAQDELAALNQAGDETGRYYCGAWQRYGFHEDGIWSAHRLCEQLIGGDPWP
ncbi:MAG: NAD(P)/FAD-dependent oxidoreductase [Roseibacillus sp.]